MNYPAKNKSLEWRNIYLICFVALIIVSCKGPKADTDNITEPTHFIENVEVVKPTFRSFISDILITGTTKPNRQVMLHAMESGYVKEVLKDIGDKVQKGELLVKLENPETRREKQQLVAEVDAKKANYNRLEKSYKKTPAITPLQLLEEAKADFLSSQARLDAVNDQLDFLNIRSPFGGIVTQRLVDEGAIVQSAISNPNTMALMEIQEVNPIRLEIPLPESDAYAIEIGMKVKGVFPELPGKDFNAEISRTSNSLDPDSKTMMVEIDIPNEDGEIKSGMYGKVVIQLESNEDVLSLPVTAQFIHQNEAFVLIVNNEKVERIPLRKGISNKDYFEILNEDLNEETLVIVQGKSLVSPGQKVEAIIKNE